MVCDMQHFNRQGCLLSRFPRLCVIALAVICFIGREAPGASHRIEIPLRDGKLVVADLYRALADRAHLPAGRNLPFEGAIPLRGLGANLYVRALNEALGEGCRLSVSDEQLILEVDPQRLPSTIDEAKAATRTFTATARPEATAAQRRTYGLWMPEDVDPTRPLVVMVHGLDCNRLNWQEMARLLEGEGHQVAYFSYPSDQSIADSARFLGETMRELQGAYPGMPVRFVAYSMGGLVCRAYIEGDEYIGGVQQLIMLGTPNHGSSWARYRVLLEAREHHYLSKADERWEWTWMITDGLGEAGRDLRPGSAFLTDLNARRRREQVAYTIIAGNQNPLLRVAASGLDGTIRRVPEGVKNVWGVRQSVRTMNQWSKRWRQSAGESDGPVEIRSAGLEGVDDLVILAADHEELYCTIDDQPPAAWDTIRQRLSR
jgi:pimeloyl-ACP methyl ester carboxylesterase